MSEKRRNAIQVKLDILRITRDETVKTRIVYGANLNFKIIKRYIGELINSGLLRKIERGKKITYINTNEGNFIIPQLEMITNIC